MKLRDRALETMKHHFKMMVTIATILLLLILGYALYLFWFVDKAVQLSFLGAIIGIPISILITYPVITNSIRSGKARRFT